MLDKDKKEKDKKVSYEKPGIKKEGNLKDITQGFSADPE